jgi:two-component system, OmpR family, sensor histidine kinase KdpD
VPSSTSLVPSRLAEAPARRAGRLTTFLGTAPGVGKTFAMLAEARRRAEAGERVVIGWVEAHGRPATLARVADRDVIAPLTTTYRSHEFAELDVAAILASEPDVVVVDELAHTWPDGSRPRWMDVAQLLSAGVDTLTTLNVTNLLSAREYVAQITGAGPVESVPDDFVRAGEVVLVDMPADVLRRRLAAGQVFGAAQVGGALRDYFRASNLEALSELGRAWMSGELDQVGRELLARRGLGPRSPRPVVEAGISGSAWSETVILHAAELADEQDADLLVVHARIADGTVRARRDELDHYRELTESLGGSYIEVEGESPARALVDQASERPVSAVVVARHRSALGELVRGSVARQLHRLRPELPLVVVHEQRRSASDSAPLWSAS